MSEYHHNKETQGGGKECFRVRVTGMTKTWKREPWRFSFPVKHGMYGPSMYITDENERDWHLASDCPRNK